MKVFKKILSLSLAVIYITMSFTMASPVESEISKYMYKDGKFDIVVASESDYLLVDYNEIDKIESNDKLIQLIDNGVTIFFYGEKISFDKVQSVFHDEYVVDFDEKSAKSISGIYITNINGKRSYGGVIDASNHILTNKKTKEKITVTDAAKAENIRVKKHNPLDYLIKMDKDIKETKKNKLNDISAMTIKTQMPASGFDTVVFNWYYDYNPYGEMKSPVYVYSHGLISGEHYADLITSITASANDGYAVVGFKSKLYANYDNQKLVDWTDLPSKTDSIAMGLSGSAPGLSYYTSTEGVDVDPNISFSGVEAEWECNSRPLALYTIDGEAFKIEPGVRLSSDDTSLQFRRYYKMDIENVFWGTEYYTDDMYSTTTITID